MSTRFVIQTKRKTAPDRLENWQDEYFNYKTTPPSTLAFKLFDFKLGDRIYSSRSKIFLEEYTKVTMWDKLNRL